MIKTDADIFSFGSYIFNLWFFSELRELNKVLHSKINDFLLLDKVCDRNRDSFMILDSLNPVSPFAFSYRFPTIHVPKEHEYLYRLLKIVPVEQNIDFLRRFIEYLAWFPTCVFDAVTLFSCSLTTNEFQQSIVFK